MPRDRQAVAILKVTARSDGFSSDGSIEVRIVGVHEAAEAVGPVVIVVRVLVRNGAVLVLHVLGAADVLVEIVIGAAVSAAPPGWVTAPLRAGPTPWAYFQIAPLV